MGKEEAIEAREAGDVVVPMPHAAALDVRRTPLDVLQAESKELREVMRSVLVDGTDYGQIGGTQRPTLFKSGAEVLLRWARLGHRLEPVEVDRDAEGRKYGVTYRCTVHALGDPDVVVATCDGYCGYDEPDREAHEKTFKRRDGSGTFTKVIPRAPWNTIVKMCVAASTPLLVRSEAGEFLTEATRLYSWQKRPNSGPAWLPGPDGEWVRIRDAFKTGVAPVLRITLRDGTEHRVTPNHRFLSDRGLVQAEDLRVGDRLTRRAIPLEGMKEPEPDLGWLVGLIIADGHTSAWGVRITLAEDQEAMAERAVWIARRLGSPAHFEPRPDIAALTVSLSGPVIVGLCKQFIAGKDSHGKHLRPTAWRAGHEFLDAVLSGWLDGDGSWTERGGHNGFWSFAFSGHNDRWARTLRVLCAVLGYPLMLRSGSASAQGKTFRTFTGRVQLGPAVRHGNTAHPSQVVAVEADGETMTYDFEVDSPDHLYLLHDGTVTHNSEKRALIGATLQATAASGLFTQDLDDHGPPVSTGDEGSNGGGRRSSGGTGPKRGDLGPFATAVNAAIPDAEKAKAVRAQLHKMLRENPTPQQIEAAWDWLERHHGVSRPRSAPEAAPAPESAATGDPEPVPPEALVGLLNERLDRAATQDEVREALRFLAETGDVEQAIEEAALAIEEREEREAQQA